MKLKTLVAAMAVVLGAPAFAAIAPFSTGNGELFLVVQDGVAKVSYTRDLGFRMDTVVACEIGAGPACLKYSFDVAGDANWQTFAGVANLSIATWAVMAGDSSGPLQAGTHRLLTTVRTADTAKIANMTNSQLSNGIGPTQGGNFFGAVNATGTHAPQTDYTINGSSVNYDNVGSGLAYFGRVGSPSGLTPTLNGNAPFNVTNAIRNAEIPLYLLSRSSSDAGGKIAVNKLNAQDFQFYANFDGQNLVVAVPEPSTYALMLSGLLAVGFIARRRRG